MKAIKFSDSELEFLQDHYELELLDAENYIAEIKNILKKLGAIEQEIALPKPVKKAAKKTGRPKKEKTVVAEAVAPPVVKAVKKATPKKAVKEVVKPVKKVAKPAKKAAKPAKKAAKPVATTPAAQPEPGK